MSIIEITARNAPQAYVEGLWKFRVMGRYEDTRNGEAIVLPAPTFLTIQFPEERLLNCPLRRANPFFHCMEFVWMMAGSNDAHWLSQFNKRMMEYADDGILRGAYGWRWANPSKQIPTVVELLSRDPDTRQAVLSMWDTVYDGPEARTSDRPCNTHIYFRVRDTDDLEMTVCNRSNDFIWGMLGANIVHMTMLHELIARAAGYKMGSYHVFSNNCHVYTSLPRFKEIYQTVTPVDMYRGKNYVDPYPLIAGPTEFQTFIDDCEALLEGRSTFHTDWVQNVAYPIKMAYLDKPRRMNWISEIVAEDWHRACYDWASQTHERKSQH